MLEVDMKPIWTEESAYMTRGGVRQLRKNATLTIHWGVVHPCPGGVHTSVWLEQKDSGGIWQFHSKWVDNVKMPEMIPYIQGVSGDIYFHMSWTATMPSELGHYRIKVKTDSACGGGEIALPYYIDIIVIPS